MELNELTAHELLEKLKKKEIQVSQILESIFQRIEKVEEKVSAFISLDKKRAREAQANLGQKKSLENSPALYGIPVAVKDNICVRNGLTTCSSRILSGFSPKEAPLEVRTTKHGRASPLLSCESKKGGLLLTGFISPYSATVVEQLEEAGSIIFGKTNLDEFAMGSSTENSCFKPTGNPWNTEFIPGGSSGGSAAAVAADETIVAIGSDTGGSIRQPAALCGVVGLKPSYGLVSRYGLVAFASSLDQIGPLTKDVSDTALVLSVLAGSDPRDSTSISHLPKKDYTLSLSSDIKGLRIGLPREYFLPGLDAEVEEAVRGAVKLLEKLGAEIMEVSLPHTEYCLPVYYIIATAEASANLARYDGVKYGYRKEAKLDLWEMYEKTRGEGFGDEVKRRIMLGTYALSAGYYAAYYLKAQKVRSLIKNDFDQAFKKVEAIITPTTPTPAFRIGEKIDDPLQMYLSDIFTISVNLAGLPAISLPCGFSQQGLPIGLQIIGPYLGEENILKFAYTYERHTEWHKKKPKLS